MKIILTTITLLISISAFSQDVFKRINRETGTEELYSSTKAAISGLPDTHIITISADGKPYSLVAITESLNHYIIFKTLKNDEGHIIVDKGDFKFLDEKTKLYKNKDLSLVLQDDAVFVLFLKTKTSIWYNATIGKSFPDLDPLKL